jgi:hypothetical protein
LSTTFVPKYVSVTGFTGATGWLNGASAPTAKGAERTAASTTHGKRKKGVETIVAPYTRTQNCPRENRR